MAKGKSNIKEQIPRTPDGNISIEEVPIHIQEWGEQFINDEGREAFLCSICEITLLKRSAGGFENYVSHIRKHISRQPLLLKRIYKEEEVVTKHMTQPPALWTLIPLKEVKVLTADDIDRSFFDDLDRFAGESETN